MEKEITPEPIFDLSNSSDIPEAGEGAASANGYPHVGD
jgi:hypothetical protein